MTTDGKTVDFVKNVLSHHGIPGMKWGRRSTTPTSARVSQKGKKLKAKGGEGNPAHADAIKKASTARVKKKSGLNALSNKELQDYAKRMQLEQSVKSLESQQQNPAKRFITSLLVNTGKNAAQTAANDAASKQVKKLLASEGKKKS